MRLKLKLTKTLLMIITMTLIFSISKSVFGITISDPTDILTLTELPSEPYEFDDTLFCIHKGEGYSVYVNNAAPDKREVQYSTNESIKLEQSVAFAVYTAIQSGDWKEEDIQNVIWSSDQFNNLSNFCQLLKRYTGQTTSATSVSMIEARSNQYAQFYYGILKNGKVNFKTESNNTTVLVNQRNHTYTTGPYSLDIQTNELNDSIKNAKQILFDELSGENAKKYPNAPAFASYEITGLDGTDIEFLDKSGEKIEFPNWGDEFYIRYKPNSGITRINPQIKINYITEVLGNGMLYTGYKGTVEGYVSDINVTVTTPDEYNSDVTLTADQFDPNDFISGTLMQDDIDQDIDLKVIEYSITDYDPSEGKEPIYNDRGNIIGYEYYETCIKKFYYKAEIEQPSKFQEFVKIGIEASAEAGIKAEWKVDGDVKVSVLAKQDSTTMELETRNVAMELGGNVWEDLPSDKLGDYTGVWSEEDAPFAGMEVRLYDESGNLIKTTATDKNGKYHFYNLDPFKKYYVKFLYNGEIYEATYYKNNLTGGYSNAQDTNRESFNLRFGTIDSTPQNYKMGGSWHKSYALLAKLARDNGEYIGNGQDENGNVLALTYQDAWNKFLEFSATNGSYDVAYRELTAWLQTKGVGQSDTANVIQFIKDCMIESTTLIDDPLTSENYLVKYPVYDTFVLEDLDNPTDNVETVTLDETYYYLYTKQSDQSRYVDFGIKRRDQENIAIQKDVYKVTVIVNGKKQEYIYSKKNANDDGSWTVEVRAADALYNGTYAYTRELRKSEYLYDDQEQKNLQVFVTYRIIVKNDSQTLYSTINEVVDYYDADQYTFDGVLNQDGTYSFNQYNEYDANGNVTNTYTNSYVGADFKGNRMQNANLTVSNHTSFADREASKSLQGANYNYSSLYITGFKSQSGNDRFMPGEMGSVYLTFKANTDATTGKVKLDQDLNSGAITLGKRNIAEINGYSTYYGPNATVPNYLGQDNSRVDTNVSNKVAGIISTQSNAGSLEEMDLTVDGDLRTSKTSQVEDRLEPDTDKAPNLKVVISQDDNDTRILSGYVYEDERTVTNDKAVVGDGKYQDGETKINGVKVELVELIQNVDDKGIFLGSYRGERVWGTATYEFQNGRLVLANENKDRYFSGIGLSKVILKGPGILNVSEDSIGENNGAYSFKSVPPGDFFIRFTYGDSAQTVLLNGDNEVNTLVGTRGLNAKSYNGQDYKSTTYQTEIDQSGSYNGINGFTNYDTQNYNVNNVTDKSAMYYYNADLSKNVQGASDAKDVYSYRESVNNWSSGASDKTLLNNRAEILDSFESLGTYVYENQEEQRKAQVDKINALIANTAMIAQTGVIDTEIEFNTTTTGNQGNNNKLSYTIDDIDLGLQERPKAQIKLNKEITNFKLKLANNQTLFDTTQSVNDLFFAKHTGHKVNYNDYRLASYELSRNSKTLPELIQVYMDEELIAGASIEATYGLSAQNVGEVDYLDKQFYYTGKSAHAGDENWVSKTNAKEVIDYVSNLSRYDANYQDVNSNWEVANASDIIKSTTINENGEKVVDSSKLDNDLVNRKYLEEISTYNTLITTDKLSSDLLPSLFNEDKSTSSTKLVLSALLSSTGEGNFVYNNLAEIVATSNTQGRRMAYSIVGNQEMSDQSLGDDTSEEIYTQVDLVTPTEIDADSAQKIVVLPPTGENRNVLPIVLIGIAVAVIVVGSVIIIKRRV